MHGPGGWGLGGTRVPEGGWGGPEAQRGGGPHELGDIKGSPAAWGATPRCAVRTPGAEGGGRGEGEQQLRTSDVRTRLPSLLVSGLYRDRQTDGPLACAATSAPRPALG
ncbi:unnamed protein product [Boreogadus saida]